MLRRTLVFFMWIVSVSCSGDKKLFERLESSDTGIDFTNTIEETRERNVLTYEYYYNGNGVAVGDLNNDGLADLFFTGNQVPSKLYINKGEIQFEEVTQLSGISGKKGWRTGASMADVNGDGLLDIYVCYSAFGSDQDRANQLFINNGCDTGGIPTFTERAAQYGVDAPGTYTSQAAFFDFDRDGDLDMFLLNHADGFYSPFFNTTRLRNLRHPQFGNRLYRNDDGSFVDVSEEAGIYGSGINFGLGISISDLNEDGWPDIFVSNDFHEQDFCYLNKKDGTFAEVNQQVFAHMSRSTMGLDIADYNNDLLPDLIAMDMQPESNQRRKLLQGADEYDKYNLMVDSGYGHQNSRNMLQLHRGYKPDGLPVFSEIGQLAGVSSTDWSWASLFADLDNDGWKDLFVTNGYLRDYTSLDFIKYDVANAFAEAAKQGKDVSTRESYEKNMPLYDLIKKMPSTRISNYGFRNNGDLTFTDISKDWGLDDKGISSGAAYVDLDNDGDLDLVVCNNNDPVWIYKNNARQAAANNYIKIALRQNNKNTFGIGAKVKVYTKNTVQLQEMYPVRGYQSSVDYVLNFGIGKNDAVEKIEVLWGNDSLTVINNPVINSLVRIRSSDKLQKISREENTNNALFSDVSPQIGIPYRHRENFFVDFKQQFLIPYELSRQGPQLSYADVNGDGLDDFFVGGAAEQPGHLFIQQADGSFDASNQALFAADAIYEDVGSLFFDADNDNDPDLYVVSGGSEWGGLTPGLQDRLYVNDGKGNFTKNSTALPTLLMSGSCVKAADYDKDGDLDLFVGSRTMPGNYPSGGESAILRNDFNRSTGLLKFTNVTEYISGGALKSAGMVADAVWADINSDGFEDLIVVGEWMPIRIFKNEQGKKITEITNSLKLEKSDGWWCRIITADVDGDGDKDFIVGNMGANTQFKTSTNEPLITYSGDFNGDGRIDPILTWFVQGKSYPYNSRDELIEQMPVLNKKFLRYKDYSNATINDILSDAQINDSEKFYIYNTRTSILINNGNSFELKALPLEAQFSSMSGMSFADYNGDGHPDILLTGNFFPFRVQEGRVDANIGCLLKGDGKGNFVVVNRQVSGLHVAGDVRDMIELKSTNGRILIVSKNNDSLQVLKPRLAKP